MQCPYCGLHYDDFRTGYTYRDVYHLIYDRKWKRRHGVLGAWHQFKMEFWHEHIRYCEMAFEKADTQGAESNTVYPASDTETF